MWFVSKKKYDFLEIAYYCKSDELQRTKDVALNLLKIICDSKTIKLNKKQEKYIDDILNKYDLYGNDTFWNSKVFTKIHDNNQMLF